MRWLFGALLLTVSALPAAAGEDFERVFRSDYDDLLRNSARAYEDKRFDEAFKLFMRAACAGDKQSQSAVGRMYLLGQGVERDDLTAYAWLKVAAEIQFPGYQTIVTKLDKAMNDQQRKIAADEADKLVALYGMRSTNMSCQGRASRGGHIVDMIECTPRSEGNQVLLKTCAAAVSALDAEPRPGPGTK